MDSVKPVPPGALSLCQVALSVADLEAASDWYRDMFDLVPAGGTRFRGAAIEALQGLPGTSSRVRWLVDRQEFFQLELFRFEQPEPRPFAAGRTLSDTGYSAIAISVPDFDAAIARLRAGGAAILEQRGSEGGRRVIVRDLDGVYVEAMEDDAHMRGAAVRGVRASVPDLDQALAFFRGVLGLEALADRVLHPERLAGWPPATGTTRSAQLSAGGRVLELVEHLDPRGQPWPADHRLSDLGLLNIAFGTRSREVYESAVAAIRAGGFPMNAEMRLDFASTIYVEDGHGFSVEVLYLAPGSDGLAGFEPREWTGHSQPGAR